MQSRPERARPLPWIVSVPVIFAVVILLIPLLPLLIIAWVTYGIFLQAVIWLCWCLRGPRVLLVYSESPKWQDHIETKLMPNLPRSVVVLNWSERRTWRRYSLSVMAFRFFGGSHEFNPIIVVFRPFRWATTFRMFKAFKDLKRGNPKPLATIESELFLHLAQSGIGQAS
jgi:hypothetical protein